MVTITEERFKTETGFGFGIFTIFKDGKKVFQTKPKLKKHTCQYATETIKIKNINDAKKIIKSRGELKTNTRIQKTILSLLMLGEFVRVSQIIKRKHQTATYRKAVDWCQSNIYIIKGIVFVEETFWKNCRLVGTGIARNTNQTIQEYLGESIHNYIIK